MRYTEKYRKLVIQCVDMAARAAEADYCRERRTQESRYRVQSDIRARLNASNADILRERMKTLGGDDLERARRTVEQLGEGV